MATITDYFTKASSGTRPVPTTTTATVASGASPGTITCAALTGWATTTPVHFVIYTTDTSGAKVAGSQIDCKGIVVGNTITGTIVKAGTNLGFSVGAIVEAAPTAAYADDLATGLAVSHNADGSLTTSSVQTALGLSSSIGAGWTPLANTFTYGANNGNKEFTVTTTADLTSVVGPGMKFQLTRGTSAPTQAMAFTAASSQYATKVTPTGITFTGAFTCEAWIYLNSYTGQFQQIVGRTDNATGGFGFGIQTTGQLQIYYWGASATTNFVSYQSIPLNRWVHVAGAVTSVASKTAALYINGVAVGSASNNTAATTLVQTGQLSVGAINNGLANTFFNGYISECRVWSAAQSQSSVQSNMAISLVGNETNLVGLWQGNGNFNDKTSNANTLTATNSAIATQAANPYNNVEYAQVAKVSYVNPTTTLTLHTGDSYNIPNMTLSSAQYSALASPIGIPNDLSSSVGRRLLWIPLRTIQSTASTTPVAFPGGSGSFTVPGNCTMVKLKAFNTTADSSSTANTSVFNFYSGSIAAANIVGQLNNTSLNSFLYGEIFCPVSPGATFSLIFTWFTTAGTVTWGAENNNINSNGIWVETA